MGKKLYIFLVLSLLINGAISLAQQRFPKPEFETGYVQPTPTTPEPRSNAFEYVDVALLFGAILLISWFALKRRSRKGILWVSVFTLLYFGFYREGCICSVGSIQNVALTLFNNGYAISLTALLFFLIPLISTLFLGRTFCAGACPLGVMQDLLIIKPISLPKEVNKILGLLPHIYLGFAILYASTGTEFIICRYDPFIGIYRFDGPLTMILLGVVILLIGLFVARPYCRFFCPYGVLLGWMSRFSKWHLTITPKNCIDCKLCEQSCPFDAIEVPTPEISTEVRSTNFRKFIGYLVILPLFMLGGGYTFSKAHGVFARAHKQVYLAELLINHPEVKTDKDNIDVQTFLSSGKSMQKLVDEAVEIRKKFYTGSWFLGGYLGLVLGIMLINSVVFRRKTGYSPHKGDCFSCGRCMDYCPVTR